MYFWVRDLPLKISIFQFFFKCKKVVILFCKFLHENCANRKNWFLGYFTKIFNFFIFCQNDSKYLSFEIFGVNFGFLAPAPYFLGFYLKFFKFWIFHQKDLKYFTFEIFGVNFWVLAPGLLFFWFFPKNFQILNFSPKKTQNTLVLRYSGLIFGFWPLPPNFLGL